LTVHVVPKSRLKVVRLRVSSSRKAAEVAEGRSRRARGDHGRRGGDQQHEREGDQVVRRDGPIA